MGLISWILVGAIAGWIAGKIMNTGSNGIIFNIVLGVIGAFIGGFVVNLFGGIGVTGFNIWSLIVSVLGAVILIWIVRKIRH